MLSLLVWPKVIKLSGFQSTRNILSNSPVYLEFPQTRHGANNLREFTIKNPLNHTLPLLGHHLKIYKLDPLNHKNRPLLTSLLQCHLRWNAQHLWPSYSFSIFTKSNVWLPANNHYREVLKDANFCLSIYYVYEWVCLC